ncbi:MAG TPA: nitroreductase/quinone reductase family protein [Candidatus Dormibacteraeota bacterium]|nr:nitroreductase/quinone reductase family protein [Candidatus Dormibacteraeota bacterium]
MNVILTTTGRKTRLPRPVTLYGFADGERLVVVGSRGGSARDPAWANNLRADPDATVRLGKEVREVRAYEAGGDERDRLWRLVSTAFPLYETYRRRTTRTIPLFILEPVADSSG